MRHVATACAALALALVWVCVGSAQTLGASVSISIVDAPRVQSKWGFAPTSRKIAPGTWVTWSNAGQEAHTVTADDGSFDSGNLDPSEGFSWYFDESGTFTYTCALHAWMTGTIVVGNGQAPVVIPPPTAVPDQFPPDPGTDDSDPGSDAQSG